MMKRDLVRVAESSELCLQKHEIQFVTSCIVIYKVFTYVQLIFLGEDNTKHSNTKRSH